MDWFWISLFAITGYFIGSVNASVIISGIFYKDDVRSHGSGNAGATNMARVYGKLGGLLALLGDFTKCVVAMLLGLILGEKMGGATLAEYSKVAAGAACLLGHAYPLYFHFKGGKGISVGAALALMVDWRIFLIILGVFILIVAITKIVSLSSVSAAVAFIITATVFYFVQGEAWFVTFWELILSVCAPVFVIFLHRGNIARLIRGEEKKFSFKKKEDRT